LNVLFPPHAVPTNVTVTYNGPIAPSHPAPDGQRVVLGFQLEARTDNGQPVTQFQRPYTLVLDYTDAQLAALGIDEASLNLAYWNGLAWVSMLPCGGCSVDTINNRVTVVADHFTEFMLMGAMRATNRNVHLPLIQR
jgi:hypothetical protein